MDAFFSTNLLLDYIISLYTTLHSCKILKLLEINSYLIYKIFKVNLKKNIYKQNIYELMDCILNNIVLV